MNDQFVTRQLRPDATKEEHIMRDVTALSNDELADELEQTATFIAREVSGQRYGVWGTPYVEVGEIREAARRLRGLAS